MRVQHTLHCGCSSCKQCHVPIGKEDLHAIAPIQPSCTKLCTEGRCRTDRSSRLPPVFLTTGAALLLRERRLFSVATAGMTAVIRRGPLVPRMFVS